jgi:hypothetical protein
MVCGVKQYFFEYLYFSSKNSFLLKKIINLVSKEIQTWILMVAGLMSRSYTFILKKYSCTVSPQ